MDVNRILIGKEHQELLRGLQVKQQALHTFVTYVTGEGQRRAEALVTEQGAAWDKVAQDLGLDLKKIEYTLSEDGTELVPVRVRV